MPPAPVQGKADFTFKTGGDPNQPVAKAAPIDVAKVAAAKAASIANAAAQKKKASPHDILIWKDNTGKFMWQDNKGNIKGLSRNTIKKLENKPDFIDAFKKAKENRFKPPEGYDKFTEGFINPFVEANFL